MPFVSRGDFQIINFHENGRGSTAALWFGIDFQIEYSIQLKSNWNFETRIGEENNVKNVCSDCVRKMGVQTDCNWHDALSQQAIIWIYWYYLMVELFIMLTVRMNKYNPIGIV